MIDGGEQPDGGKAQSQGQRRVGQPRQDRRTAQADEEDDHHAAPAPVIAEPAGRQGAGAEGDEAEDRERQEIAVAAPESAPESQNDGRKEEHEHVVVEMTRIEEKERQLRAVYRQRAFLPGRSRLPLLA